MSVWKKIMLLCAVALLSLAIVGCGGGDKNGKKAEKAPKGKATVEAPAVPVYAVRDKVPIQVYLDGTVSMAGYVSDNSSEYLRAIKAIDRVAMSGVWKSEEQKDVKYIKFGDKFQTLDRDAYLLLNTGAFYDQTNTNLPSVIRQIKANSGDNPLSIVVTDLFQTDQDIESLNWALKETCFGEGKAVAVVGIKSQFDGDIYDVGRDKEKFAYASRKDIASFRPFYLLILGKDSDVREFVLAYQKEYVERERDNQYLRVAFFSRDIGANTALTVNSDSNKELKKVKISAMKPIESLLSARNDIPQLRMDRDKKKSGAILDFSSNKVIGSYPNDYTLKFVKMEKWDNSKDGVAAFKENNNIDIEEFTEDSEINDLSFQKGKVTANIKLVTHTVGIKKKEGKYRLRCALLPSKSDYLKKVNCFDEWNFAESDIGGEDSMAKLGGKTQNIKSFVDSLAELNHALNNPGFHDLWIYFNVK